RATVAHAHDCRGALHDRPLRRVRRAGGRLAAFAIALRLLAHEREEARRVLERGETARRSARTPRRPRSAPDRRDRGRRSDTAPDGEGTQPTPAAGTVHAT